MSSHNSVTLCQDAGQPVARLSYAQLTARVVWLTRLECAALDAGNNERAAIHGARRHLAGAAMRRYRLALRAA